MDISPIESLREALTPKELIFADLYLGEAHHNGTKAAQLAGYKGNKNALGVAAFRILKKPHVKAYIEQSLADSALSAQETLVRLTAIARSTIDDVISDNGLWFDMEKARANGSIHFVKKLKSKRQVREKKVETVITPEGEQKIETSIIFEEVEFEMFSAHEALYPESEINTTLSLFSNHINKQPT